MIDKDIRLEIRARNARVLRAMKAAGFDTVAALCRAMPGSPVARRQGLVGQIINFKQPPTTKRGRPEHWRKLAVEIATALHFEPEQLWPEYMQRVQVDDNVVIVDVSAEEMAALAAPPDVERLLIEHEQVQRLLDHLKPQQRAVIELRYGLNGNGEHTLRQIAEVMNLGPPERVRQLEYSAMRRMRHPKLQFRAGTRPEQ